MPKKPQTGFTLVELLVELLVVIAIIGILAALLLTAVSAAKGRTQRIQCASNLHQLGLALQEFRTDQGFYPPYLDPSSAVNSGDRYWMGGLQSQLDSHHVADYHDPKIYPSGVWHCPSAHRPMDFNPHWSYDNYGYNRNGLGIWDFTNSSLGLSEHFPPYSSNGPRRPTPHVKESEVVNPGEMYALGDAFYGGQTLILDGWIFEHASDNVILSQGERMSDMVHGATKYDFSESTKRAHVRHQGKANVVFCDGHVESPTLKYLFADTSDEALSRWNRDHQPHRERLPP